MTGDRPARQGCRWTDEEKALAIELLQAGRSNREIGEQLDRTPGTVGVMLNHKLGVTRWTGKCEYCDVALPVGRGRNRRFCNRECRDQRRVRSRAARAELRAAALLAAGGSCSYCGGPMSDGRVLRVGRPAMYCSRDCNKNAWYARKCARLGKDAPTHKGKRRPAQPRTAQLLVAFDGNAWRTAAELGRTAGIPPQVSHVMRRLVREGWVVRDGEGRGARYQLSAEGVKAARRARKELKERAGA